ncbi:hypothetical protein BGW41_003161 [Actinomortierella wolfii]|nr:hypothetical protein BGW41_003161 [Actinomortierella wolfii]
MDLVETLINLPIKEKEYTAILVADENRGGNTNDSSTAARSNSPSFATAAAARHIGNPASPPRSSSAGAIYRTQPQQHTLTESRHSHSGSESSLLALALGRTSIGHPRSYSGSGSSIYSEDSGAGTGHRRSISSSWDESAMEYIRLRPPSWIALGHGMDGLNGLRPASISAVATKKQNNGHKGSDLTSDERHQFFVLRPDPQQRSRKQIMVATTSPTSHSSKAGGGMRRSHLVLQRDFDWAVDQIQDRRMRILEAHEFLNGLMMRFYPDEARFAT